MRVHRFLPLLFLLLPEVAMDQAAHPAPAGQWTQFQDPNEHAFTIDVPAGWKTEGGMLRRSAVDLSMFLRVLSPDGSVLLLLGDPGPAYFPEPGLGSGPRARPPMSGMAYARQYVQQSMGGLCSGLTFEKGNDRPDLSTGKLTQMTALAQHSAGDALFSCTHGGKPVKAYMVALTYRYAPLVRGVPRTWGVGLLAGCIAPADRVIPSTQLIVHMLQSAHLDPQWAKTQQARVDATTRNINIITAAQQQAFDQNLADAKAQQAQMDQQFNRMDDIINGTGTFKDQSGNVYRNVQNTQPYHWVGPGGQTRETSGPNSPGPGWTPLQPAAPR
jgi:hypothetical protein